MSHRSTAAAAAGLLLSALWAADIARQLQARSKMRVASR